MGDYVPNTPEEPFRWGRSEIYTQDSLEATQGFVEQKFAQTLGLADELYKKLAGENGNGGYLRELTDVAGDIPVTDVTAEQITIPVYDIAPALKPDLSKYPVDTSFPTFDKIAPAMKPLPEVDISSVRPVEPPDGQVDQIQWVETAYSQSFLNSFLSLVADGLQNGSSGVPLVAEQAIYERARARQAVANDKLIRDAENYFAARGFSLPPGAMAGRIAEAQAEIARNDTEINSTIIIEQAERAYKHREFLFGLARDLEALFRDFHNQQNNRALDYAKAFGAHALGLYTQLVTAYRERMLAHKAYIEVQVENLKAVVESNRGLMDTFKAEVDAHRALIEGKKSGNDAIIGLVEAEAKVFEAESRDIASQRQSFIDHWKLVIENADQQLRASIAQANNIIQGYTASGSLKERAAETLAQITNQALASALGATNVSTGMSWSAGRSESESFGHSESRSVGFSHSQSLGENHSFTEV